MKKYLKYKNLYIPAGIDQNSKPNPVDKKLNCPFFCRMLGKMHLVETCDGISCAKCICSSRNADIASDYFLCDQPRSSTAPGWVREFMGVKIPANIDEHYEATMRVRPWFHACTATDHDGHDCSEIICSDCILYKGNESIARKYFNCLKQKEKREMKIDTSKVHVDDIIHKFTSCYCETEDDRYYVVIRFSTNRAEAEVMLKAIPMLPTFLWVEDPKDAAGCMIMVPFCLRHQAEEFQTELSQALGRLSKKSEVDEFLDVTNACADGRKFAADCSSMYEVWVKAVQQQKANYIEFMLQHIISSSAAAKFHTSGVPMEVLKWAYPHLPLWGQDSLDIYLKFNPFERKED